MATKKFSINETDLVDYKRKKHARATITRMLKRGEMVRPDKCELCHEKSKTEGHHLDYGQPDKVVWLCDKCHGLAHRPGHHLNPDHIPQTENELVWGQKDFVTVSVHVPVENFILLKKLAEQNKTNVSKLVRGCVLDKYAVDDKQLKFNIFGEKHEPDSGTQKRVQMLEHNKKRLHQQKPQKIWPLWVAGFDLGERVGRLQHLFCGHGADASLVRWVSAAR